MLLIVWHMHSANAPSTIKYNTGRPRNASVSVWINTIKTRNVSAKTNHTVDFQGTYLSDNLFVTDIAVYLSLSPGIFHTRGRVFVPTINFPPATLVWYNAGVVSLLLYLPTSETPYIWVEEIFFFLSSLRRNISDLSTGVILDQSL